MAALFQAVAPSSAFAISCCCCLSPPINSSVPPASVASSFAGPVFSAAQFTSRPCRSSIRNGRRSKYLELAKMHTARGAASNGNAAVEIMDPVTGKYRKVGRTAEEEEYGVDIEGEDDAAGENEEELLKNFASAIGLDDEEAVGTMFSKMRNPTSERIVKQLEEGIGDLHDLTKEIYGGIPQLRDLYTSVESLIEKGDLSGAHDVIEGNYDEVLEDLQEGSFTIEQVAMLDILASLYLRLEDKDSAEQLLEQARDLLNRIPDSENLVENVLEHVATLHFKIKRHREAVRLYKRCLSIRKASEVDVPSIVRTMMGLAATYSELQEVGKSIELFKQILAYSEEALGAEDEDLAAPLMHLGSSLLEEHRTDEAEMMIQRAIKLTERVANGKDGRYGIAICVFGQVKAAQGEFEEAIDCFRRGLQVLEGCPDFKSEGLSPEMEEISLSTIRMDLAALYTVIGRQREAQEVMKQVRIRDNQQQQYYTFQQVEYLEKLAEKYADGGELEKSEKALRQSLQLLITTAGPDSVQVSVVLQLLATLLHAQPDRDREAEPLIRESIRIREKEFGTEHLAVGEAYSYLASILHHQDQDAEAAQLMYKVLDIQQRDLGPDHPQLEETLDVLNMLLVNLGRYGETIPITERLERMRTGTSSFGV